MPEPQQQPPPNEQLPPVPGQPPAADPEVARLTRSVQDQRSEIDRLKRLITAPPQPVAQPGQQMSREDMDKQFFRNPIDASIAIATKAAQDTMAQQQGPSFDTLVQVARNEARGTDVKQQAIFDKYIAEIEVAVATAPPNYRTNVNVWRNAFNVTKGAHLEEILAEAGTSSQTAEPPRSAAVHIRDGSGPAPSSPRPGQPPRGEQLSAEEQRVARKFKMSDERYLAGKKHYEGQTDPQSNPIGPSSWDPMITFDSADSRRKAREARKAAKK